MLSVLSSALGKKTGHEDQLRKHTVCSESYEYLAWFGYHRYQPSKKTEESAPLCEGDIDSACFSPRDNRLWLG